MKPNETKIHESVPRIENIYFVGGEFYEEFADEKHNVFS